MTTPTDSHCLHRHHGFTLVEMMIAIALGLLITSVVIGIFLSGNRNYAQDERYARLQENARFAMKTLMTDVSSGDFWGSMVGASAITGIGAACGITLDAANPLDVLIPSTAAAIEAKYTCITDAKENTSVLVIKRVQGACYSGDPAFVPACTAGVPPAGVYLRTNGYVGRLITVPTDTTTASAGRERDWEFIPRIYYIRRFSVTDGDGIPTLVRKALQGGVMVSQPLVDGVENFRLTAGVLSGTEAPTPIKIDLLVRSLDRDPEYDTNRAGVKTFTLGATCFNIAGDNGCLALQSTDNTPQRYYRRVFTSTVAARNAGLLRQF